MTPQEMKCNFAAPNMGTRVTVNPTVSFFGKQKHKRFCAGVTL